MRFLKVQGLGNDFVLLDRVSVEPSSIAAELIELRKMAPLLCDRRTGIGGDGILVVTPSEDERAVATMIVINNDGSRPEMCGNGVRCVAQWLAERLGSSDVRINTDAGARNCVVVSSRGGQAEVAVEMGPAHHLGDQHPTCAAGRRFASVSMGNPHAIYFVAPDEDPRTLAETLGPAVEIDPAYPDRTNVEFARRDDDGLTLWVWERGCGITGACGTGACATAAAAVRAGLAQPDTEIIMRLPGGVLRVRVPADPSADIVMIGPSRIVFAGDIEMP